jgi:arginyl-tRNA synthetase
MRSHDQHLEFDLELAKSRSNDNPVYYIQYAHARIASVFRKLAEEAVRHDATNGQANLGLLAEVQEKSLVTALSRYPEVIELAATNRAPQHLVHYLRDLANDFHTNYNANRIRVDDADLRDARLTLAAATQVVLANGLGIIGVTAPEQM